MKLGLLYEILYPIDMESLNASQRDIVNEMKINSIIVSTTRPETLFGDIAVAVNPNDHRYNLPDRSPRGAPEWP